MPETAKSSFATFVNERIPDNLKSDVESNSAVICAASPGNPVLYVSDAFQEHTGYSLAEIAGKSLAILQGAQTEPEAVERFRHLISTGTPGTIRITNYRKDKTEFLHECELRPIYDADGQLTHFAAIQRPV